jgi:hypothetical protein
VLLVASLLSLSIVQIEALSIEASNKTDLVGYTSLPTIKKIFNKFTLMDQTYTLKDSFKATYQPQIYRMGTDIPIMNLGLDGLNPTMMTDKTGNIVMASEVYEDIVTTNVYLRYSNDGGITWLPEDGTIAWDLPSNNLIPEKPVIDYAGDNGGFGSYIPLDLSLPTMDFDDITNPDIGDGWTIGTWTTNDNMVEIDSVDVCGINSRYSPDSFANGIVCYTGDGTDGTTNVLYLGWQEGENTLHNLWTGSADAEYEWENVKADNDLTTGLHYEAYEIKNNSDENQEGVEIDWCLLDGTADWWINNEWFGLTVDDAKYPDIDAANGLCYCVYELNGGIYCTYSNDNAQNFQSTQISSHGRYPNVAIMENTILCSCLKDGNLYSFVSEDFGNSWEESIINDQSGSVVEDTHSTAVAGSYLAWTDKREAFDTIYFDKLEVAVPIIEIHSISGGLGLRADIINSGTADATNIPWQITLDGGAFVGKETTGTIDRLSPGASETIKTSFIIGFGKTDITIIVGATSKKMEGMVLLFFIGGVK